VEGVKGVEGLLWYVVKVKLIKSEFGEIEVNKDGDGE
jgi:hypothetical protein